MVSVQETITLRVPDACTYLGISHYLLRKLVRERKIAHIRAGKLLLFRQESLDAYLENAESETRRLEDPVVYGIRAIRA